MSALTIRQLIEQLNTIENQEQVFIGDIWLAEDFITEDDQEQEVIFTPEELAQIAESRRIQKSLGYFYEEALEMLISQREEK